MTRRSIKILGLFALAPLLMGGGGINPPISDTAVVILSNITMVVTVDPHPPDSTPSALMGQITLRRGSLVATETFELIYPFGSFGPLEFGCTTDPAVKGARLGNADSPVTMNSWIPQDVLVPLFARIGIQVYSQTPPTPPLLEPIITRIRTLRCVQTVVGTTQPAGIMWLDAVVGFYAEPGTTIAHP